MSGKNKPPQMPAPDPWAALRPLTTARIGLSRSGASLATEPLLEFRLAHARARDAVNTPFDAPALAASLQRHGIEAFVGDSAAPDKRSFLMRPDLGRKLAPETEAMLRRQAGGEKFDVALTISDGLSALAAERHALPVLARLIAKLVEAKVSVAPVAVLRQGRVAIGDDVAALTRACCAIILIGERPGLSAPDSLGAYLTWLPNASTTDADRNCISNIRPEGIGYDDAARKIAHLLAAIRTTRSSGVALKDTSDSPRLVMEK